MLNETLTYSAVFLEGLLSFLTPCIYPLIPAYFTYITGCSLDELTAGDSARIHRRTILATLAFVIGFSTVFVLLGASASLLGNVLTAHGRWIRISGGVLIVLFGIHVSGLYRLKFLEIEKRLNIAPKTTNYFTAFVIGMAFGIGWTPCISPILGSVMVLAMNRETVGEGMVLLGVYSAGLALPFILLSIFIQLLIVIIQKFKPLMKYVNAVAGIILIIVGVLLMFDKLGAIGVNSL